MKNDISCFDGRVGVVERCSVRLEHGLKRSRKNTESFQLFVQLVRVFSLIANTILYGEFSKMVSEVLFSFVITEVVSLVAYLKGFPRSWLCFVMNWHKASPILSFFTQNSRDVLENIFLDSQRLLKYKGSKTNGQVLHYNIVF